MAATAASGRRNPGLRVEHRDVSVADDVAGVRLADLVGLEQPHVEAVIRGRGEGAADGSGGGRADHERAGQGQQVCPRGCLELSPERESLLQQGHVPRALEIRGPGDARLAVGRTEARGEGSGDRSTRPGRRARRAATRPRLPWRRIRSRRPVAAPRATRARSWRSAGPGVTGSPTLSSSSSTFPVTGDGISALTLSVCASIRVSPSATCSPRFLLQAPTVISSAPWSSGMTTSRTSTVTPLFSAAHARDTTSSRSSSQ